MHDEKPVALATGIRLARQPICDTHQRTFGYELQFRNPEAAGSAAVADYAPSKAVIRSFMDIGLDPVVGTSAAFIPVTPDFIVGGHCSWLPKDRVIAEVAPDVLPNTDLATALRTLRSSGYRFALDRINVCDDLPAMLDLVDFVKVDLLEAGEREIERRLPFLLNSRKSLIAQRVETPEEFEFCKRNGFQYFQGYFFCRPETTTAASIPVNRVSMFRLLSKLHDSDASPREIEKLVAEDLALSYKLLRYINSAYIGLPHKIESIVHAVRLVGMEQVRKIASLILLSAAKSEPRELIRVSLIRGKMCELMAERLRHEKKETFFTVGLFSTLDAFLDCPMKQALQLLPFSEEIRGALLDRTGIQGKALDLALMYESCCLDELPEQFDARTLQDAYWKAVEWQQDVMLRIA